MVSMIHCLGRLRRNPLQLMLTLCLAYAVYVLGSRYGFTTASGGADVALLSSSTNGMTTASPILRYLRIADNNVDVWDNLHQYKFSMNSNHCKDRASIVVIVHTAMYNFKKRQKIRKITSGSDAKHGSVLTVVFFVGKTNNASLQTEVKRESQKYRDMVQGNFIDSYHNMTHKHIMAFHWVLTYCKNVKYVIKIDDDVILHSNNVLRYLLFNPIPAGNILCFLIVRSKRLKVGKWAVAEKDYPFPKYPPYCGGFAYMTTLPVIKKLYRTSANIQSIWIDDAYATGILALASETKLIELPKGTRL
ncbi:beta-1,3-galactosyltransferase 1-like [Haliotis rufescens]|uniref:beta-1,3-galactosyltransferase 1-like n=1 Tax=Haliotis rufescens TaxID=6454 RepID=UPI00201E8F6E|nr:beta-1,3-galactosyltransferase 1-like [Haliotis rufescens]XP_046371849.2 beta-1,3-galactosyltransferase 1-like [Haliotis rufescens]